MPASKPYPDNTILNMILREDSNTDWSLKVALASGSIQIASASLDMSEVIKVASTDNTDDNARLFKVDSTGALQLASGSNKIGDVHILKMPTVSIATGSIFTTNGTAIASNANRIQWSIQNLATSSLYVRLGTGASNTNFHVVLEGGTAQDDGKGGFFSNDKYTGAVSASGSADTTPRYVVSEL